MSSPPTLPDPLPFATPDLPGIPGTLRSTDEDFVVEELPAYPPAGNGEHLFVHLEKRGLTTAEAVKRLARALGVDPRKAGYAGMKDRHAVTRQWVSFEGADPRVASALSPEDLPGIRVLAAEAHPHKLRTGHLRGNRFSLRLRGTPGGSLAAARAILARLERDGLPNYFGEQRFGRDGSTLVEARRTLIDEGRPPRDRFKRKLFASALQSALFNAVVAERVRSGVLAKALRGDVLRKEETGGLFVTEDLVTDGPRVVSWEVSPTGPLPGPKMRSPEHEARTLEEEAAARMALGGLDSLGQTLARLAPGGRRAARVRPTDGSVAEDDDGLLFTFRLPAGSYATVLMREVTKNP